MWRIGIAGIVLVWAAIAGGLVISEAGGGARSQPREVAARQVPAIASDVDTSAGLIGGNERVALAQGMRDQLRRELFGAAASDRQPRQADEPVGDPPAAAPARDPGTGAGATGDIPASMTASLPPPAESAPAADAPRQSRAAPKADPPLQASPAPPRPQTAAEKPAHIAPRASPPARAAVAPAPAAAKGIAGDPKVAEAQRLLAILGYAPGAADGRPGRQTTAAVLAYQSAAGLPVDGQIDAPLLSRLRKDMRSPETRAAPVPGATATRPASLTERILGGMQRLINRDLDSVRAPKQLAEYCRSRADEWIYDRGQDRLRHCGDINGGGRIAYRPLPGDR
jgi:Putative peptidoglycan binding domain